MATWSISPPAGVTNNNNGTFIFPENDTPDDISYEITYENNGCTATANYVLHGKNTYDVTITITPTDDNTCQLCGQNYYPTKFLIKLSHPITGTLNMAASGGCRQNDSTVETVVGTVSFNNSDSMYVTTSNFNFTNANKGIKKLVIEGKSITNACEKYNVSSQTWEGKCSGTPDDCSFKVKFNNWFVNDVVIKLKNPNTGEVYYTFNIEHSSKTWITLNLDPGEDRLMILDVSANGWVVDYEHDEVHCGDEISIELKKTVTVWGRISESHPMINGVIGREYTLGYFDVVDENNNPYEMPFRFIIRYYVYVSPNAKCGCNPAGAGSCTDGPYVVEIDTDDSSGHNGPTLLPNGTKAYVCRTINGHTSYDYIDCGSESSPSTTTRISISGTEWTKELTKDGLTIKLRTECPF